MTDTALHPYCGHPPAAVLERAAGIRAALFDVDGVLTDGTVYCGGSGDALQVFHIHDGKGLRLLLDAGVQVGWITARGGSALMRRADELGIPHVLRGRADKGEALAEMSERLAVPLSGCAYTGDDLIDLPAVRRAGLGIAVADAHPHVQAHADWVTRRPGGRGAVREVSELILLARGELATILHGAEG